MSLSVAPRDSTPDREAALSRAFLLIAAFALVEIAGAWIGNSLTLAADAGHMVLDASALGLAWCALRLSRRARDDRFTYGYHRFQVLAAFVNALVLLAACVWILVKAAARLGAPEPILPLPVLAVAVVGLAVNIAAWRMLRGHRDLNLRAAALHVLGDILGSAAAIAAALAALWFDWRFADPALALVVAAILARGAWRVLKTSALVLLEAAPRGLDLDDMRIALQAQVPGVLDVHHIHAWALTGDRPLLTLHAAVDETADSPATVNRIKAVLSARFGIDHATVQLDRGGCPDDRRDRPAAPAAGEGTSPS